jgi:hypothetical protein
VGNRGVMCRIKKLWLTVDVEAEPCDCHALRVKGTCSVIFIESCAMGRRNSLSTNSGPCLSRCQTSLASTGSPLSHLGRLDMVRISRHRIS